MPPFALLSALLTADLAGWARRLRINAMWCAAAGLAALTAWVLAIAALAAWLSQELGAIGAMLTIAAIFAALAIAVLAGLWVAARRRQRRRSQADSRNLAYAATLAMAAPTVLRSGKLGLGLAAAAGVGLALLMMRGGSKIGDEA